MLLLVGAAAALVRPAALRGSPGAAGQRAQAMLRANPLEVAVGRRVRRARLAVARSQALPPPQAWGETGGQVASQRLLCSMQVVWALAWAVQPWRSLNMRVEAGAAAGLAAVGARRA